MVCCPPSSLPRGTILRDAYGISWSDTIDRMDGLRANGVIVRRPSRCPYQVVAYWLPGNFACYTLKRVHPLTPFGQDECASHSYHSQRCLRTIDHYRPCGPSYPSSSEAAPCCTSRLARNGLQPKIGDIALCTACLKSNIQRSI